MNSFAYIASHFFPDVDILKVAFAFPDNRSSVINTDFISYGFLNALHFGKSKFAVLESSVLSNKFIDDERRENMLSVFSKSQRTYRGFARLALLHKISHARIYNADTDLCFNSLTSLSNKIVTSIYDDEVRTIYKFRISDVINITKAALSNAPSFFTEPLSIKNPYTNLPFSVSQLYHLYFVFRESSYIMPTLFHHFFECHFDLEEFASNHEALIRDESLKIFLLTSTHDQRYFHIMKMLTVHEEHLSALNIHPHFPAKKLVEGLSPFLKDYLYGVYSLNPSLRFHARRRLRTSLIRFIKLNPSYGRKVFRRNRFMDTIGASSSAYSPSNSYHSDPRPGHENLSFRFVDDVITEPSVVTPRQVARRRRMRNGGHQPVSPGRAGPRRSGANRNSSRRQNQPQASGAVQHRYSPQNYIVDEATDATDNTEGTDNSDDDPTVRHDIQSIDASLNTTSSTDVTEHPANFSSPISMMYDGAEYPDTESEDHTESNRTPSTLMEIEEGNNDAVEAEDEDDDDDDDDTASFDSSEGDSDSVPLGWPPGISDAQTLPDARGEMRSASASVGWPSGISDADIRNSEGEILFSGTPLSHIHEDIDIPEDIEADYEEGSISHHARSVVDLAISDIVGNLGGVAADILGGEESTLDVDNLVASIASAPRTRLVHPTPMLPSPPPLPAPPLPIPLRHNTSLSFPSLPPPPPSLPPPVFPVPPRSASTTPFESELSNDSTLVPPTQSDDE